MKSNRLQFLLLTVIFVACNSKEKPFKFPVIFDEFLKEDGSSAEVHSVEDGNHPYYFGKYLDTIKVGRQINNFLIPPPPSIPENYHKDFWDSIERTKLYVEIKKLRQQVLDNKTQFEDYFIKWGDSRVFKREVVSLEIFLDTLQRINKGNKIGFPVLIKNTSKDTIDVGYGDLFHTNLEAKNSTGEWIEVKKIPRLLSCGTSPIVLPPNEYVLTSQMIYLGNFKTKFRLKMLDNYSEEFWGEIDEKLIVN